MKAKWFFDVVGSEAHPFKTLRLYKRGPGGDLYRWNEIIGLNAEEVVEFTRDLKARPKPVGK